LAEEDSFNLSTMLNLKQSMNVRPAHTIKPKHTNINEGSMIKLFSMERKHEHVTVNIGQPPGRALFKVKSRTYLASGQDMRANIFFTPGQDFA
jgi:hypothetical protein